MSIQSSTLRRMMALAGALAVTAAGGLANAQQSKDDKPIKGSFDQPLQADGDEGQGDSNATMMMSQSDGQHTYSIKIENGKVVSAEMDGQKIPKSRVKNKNGKVEIYDEDGNVLKSFNVQMGAHAFPGGAMTVRPWNGQGVGPGQGAGQGLAVTGPQPPVMMGITMSDPSEGDGVVVDSVFDGLPADKAGLEVGDRIVSADGKKIESQQALRDILKDKKPGDTIDLKVDRDGKSKNISIKLARFEPNRLQGMGAMGGPVLALHNSNEEAFENAKKALQKALEDIKANENLKADKIKAKAEQALNEALDSLEKAKGELSIEAGKLHDQLMQQLGDGKWKEFIGPEGGQFVMPQPVAPPAPATPDISKQLDKLSQQIERLNKRLEQLEKDNKK